MNPWVTLGHSNVLSWHRNGTEHVAPFIHGERRPTLMHIVPQASHAEGKPHIATVTAGAFDDVMEIHERHAIVPRSIHIRNKVRTSTAPAVEENSCCLRIKAKDEAQQDFSGLQDLVLAHTPP